MLKQGGRFLSGIIVLYVIIRSMPGKQNKISFFWIEQGRPAAPFHYKTTASFYASPAWLRLRDYKLSLNPFCERCSRPEKLVQAEEVHHKEEISIRPDLSLEITNLESLCKKCHSQESAKYLQGSQVKKGTIINFKHKHIDKNGK